MHTSCKDKTKRISLFVDKKKNQKSDVDKKLINIDKKITSNKIKHIEADKKLTDLTNKFGQISEKDMIFY